MKEKTRKKLRWVILVGITVLAGIVVLLIVLADRYVEPVLKKRLHTLIIEGSDSLYTYRLGDLQASFFGGNIEIDDLHIQVDSNRYYQLEARNALPSLTLELDMHHGHLHGLSVFPLLFGKKISVRELKSEDADIRLTRQKKGKTRNPAIPDQPFWRAIQPAISKIVINRIRLNGMKLLYKSADTALSMKLQFDTCHAKLDDIRIDSIGAYDTSRIGFAKDVHLVFRDLKFRTADSASKMKAESFEYSSVTRKLEVMEFKIQPTLKDKNEYYRSPFRKEGMSVVNIQKATFTGFRLEKYILDNFFIADSLLMDRPDIALYADKTYPSFMGSKVGSYPHQQLQNANSYISLNGIGITKAKLSYTEKAEKTREEGTIRFHDVDIRISNVTNDPVKVKKQPKAEAVMQGKILHNSPFLIHFTFHLDSSQGQFDASGWIKNVSAEHLNSIAVPLANTHLQSFNMQEMNFSIHGDDMGAGGRVGMKYNNLFVVLRKKDPDTGAATVNNFFTKLMNKYVLHSSNPGADGVERVAIDVRKSRLSYQGFSGLVWKTVFSGMQDVMVKSGSFE